MLRLILKTKLRAKNILFMFLQLNLFIRFPVWKLGVFKSQNQSKGRGCSKVVLFYIVSTFFHIDLRKKKTSLVTTSSRSSRYRPMSKLNLAAAIQFVGESSRILYKGVRTDLDTNEIGRLCLIICLILKESGRINLSYVLKLRRKKLAFMLVKPKLSNHPKKSVIQSEIV